MGSTSTSGGTLAQQLKKIAADDTDSRDVDIDSAYSNLDTLAPRQIEREHYLDVGPSRLRRQTELSNLGERYEGKRVGRMKIFDDDDDEQEEEVENGDIEEDEGSEDEDGDMDEDEDDEEEGEEEEGEEDDDGEEELEDGEEDGDGSDGEEGDEEEGDASQTIPPARTAQVKAISSQALNPLNDLREARSKDIEKGRAIRRQKSIFESLLTMRITFQKAWTASQAISRPFPTTGDSEIEDKRREVLKGLGELSEKMFELREGIRLPGTELGKRQRIEEDVTSEEYWVEAGRESIRMVDASVPFD